MVIPIVHILAFNVVRKHLELKRMIIESKFKETKNTELDDTIQYNNEENAELRSENIDVIEKIVPTNATDLNIEAVDESKINGPEDENDCVSISFNDVFE